MLLHEIFYALFVLYDADGSGTMELDEFANIVGDLGQPDFE